MILGLILITALISGCGTDKAEVKPCKDILESLKENGDYGFDIVYTEGDENFDESFEFLYDFEKRLVDDSAIMFIEDGGYADEISLFHVKESGDVKIVREKLELRIESRLQVFNAYKPEEASKVSNAKVMVSGNYVALIISSDNEMAEADIRKIIAE